MTTSPLLTSRRPLTRAASLNALAAGVDYGVRIVIQLVMAPLMLTFLGAGGYGVWQVVLRLIGHATPAGGRPGEALKWVVAHQQRTASPELKRQQVGTAVAVWALFLPPMVVLGLVLAWFSPGLVHADPSQVWPIRVAAALMVLNLALAGIALLPQSVLQGENLGYRRLGLSTAILVVGALIAALALWAGWGLVGLAVATLAATALTGVTNLLIVRSQLPWWGIAAPVRGSVGSFVGLSWWFLLWNLVMQAMKGADVILLGALAGTALVATYSLMLVVPTAVGDVVFMVVSATMPGLAGIVGSGDLRRAARVRAETLATCWLLAVVSGATVIIWLPGFLRLWVGAAYDAGTLVTVLMCVSVLQFALMRVDSNVIDLTLRIRGKVLLGLASTALCIGLGLVLVGPLELGIPGLLVSLVLGRLVLSVAYPVLLARLLHLDAALPVGPLVRPALTTVALFSAAVVARGLVPQTGWVALVTLGSVTAVTLVVAAYALGLGPRTRRVLRTRALRVVGRT